MTVVINATVQSLLLSAVFINVRKAAFRASEFFSVFLSLIAIDLILTWAMPVLAFRGIVGNLVLIVILTVVAYSRNKILQLSAVYAIFTSILILLSAMLANAVFTVIYITLPGIVVLGHDAVMGDIYMILLYLTIVALIAVPTSYKIGRMFERKLKVLDTNLQRKLSNYLLAGTLITLGIFFVTVFLHDVLVDTDVFTLVYAISFSVVFAFLVFAVFAFADNFSQEIEIKHQNELLHNLELYTQHVEAMATEMRMFRHDHKNLMLGFHTHIETLNWVALREYYDAYLGEFTKSSNAIESCMDRLSNIHAPELKTILFLKFLQVDRLGVDIIIEVENPVTITGAYNLLDICRIVGILMDNAMEACQGVDGAIVRLLATMSGNCAYFVFQNTCQAHPPINEINKKGFTTKEGSRGMGLYNVSELIRKNKSLFLQTKIADGHFTQELKVSLEK